jgi:hypothetical protein
MDDVWSQLEPNNEKHCSSFTDENAYIYVHKYPLPWQGALQGGTAMFLSPSSIVATGDI